MPFPVRRRNAPSCPCVEPVVTPPSHSLPYLPPQRLADDLVAEADAHHARLARVHLAVGREVWGQRQIEMCVSDDGLQ